MPVTDLPDWASPSGNPPAQLIGAPIGATGTLALGEDPAGDARAFAVDFAGRLLIA